MFYEPDKRDHGLPRDPFKSLIIPRPIGWISTLSLDGVVNLAPYSHFNICAIEPHAVMFSSGTQMGEERRKDSQRNAEDTGEFVVNLVSYGLHEQMNLSSAPVPRTESEVDAARLKTAPSRIVKPPRVAESPIQLECKHMMTIVMPAPRSGGDRNSIVIGLVVGVHIADDVITDGRVDVEKVRPVARLGYMDYAVVDKVFTMHRPGSPGSTSEPETQRRTDKISS
jgi:flavin reductase (DIM6/NTAB) family NADH-FMN oxidoreductase RutF